MTFTCPWEFIYALAIPIKQSFLLHVLLKSMLSVLGLLFNFIHKSGKKEHSGEIRVFVKISLEEIHTKGLRHKTFVNKYILCKSGSLYVFYLRICKR